MSSVASPVTVLINRLAAGPTAPAADGPPLLTRVAGVVARMGSGPWARRLIADERNLVTLIASPPGGGNRPHWHREFDEWWDRHDVAAFETRLFPSPDAIAIWWAKTVRTPRSFSCVIVQPLTCNAICCR